ncbi:peptidoglycan-binding protein [Leptolyngbya sp. GB1-A1]|uniref:peptidoglycan-binding domain-containing protein n=1 Tax=Leptolyngbya sp. GB1-A1 TaxID=2933908 RepID=UPI00329859F4
MSPEYSASPRSSQFSQNPVLYPWDVGPAVAEMQDLLRAHGYSLRVDGDFGWKTEMLVKAFQRKQGIRTDGIVGRETWNVLRSTVQPGTRVLKQGLVGEDVAELQGLLQVNGYAVDRSGHFDAATQEAVIQFQQRHNLKNDGIVTGVMWTLLQGRKEPTKMSNPFLLNRFRKPT